MKHPKDPRLSPLRHASTVAVVALCAAACAVTAPPGERVGTTSSALGNDIQYCDFSSVAGLKLNGNATQVGTTLRLTTNTANQDSSAFRTTTLALTATTNFHTHFQFVLTPGGSQADGVTFVVQSDARGDAALGGNGGGIGYGMSNGGTPIKPSVIVEFDAYQNAWDPNANHVGVMTGGDETTHVAVGTPAFALASSAAIDAWVDYTAATTTLQVFVSNSGTKPATALVTTAAVNVFTTVGAAATFGFTGSTGGSSELQVFDSWILSLQGLSECKCTSDAQCGGTTPRCEAPPGTCVQCLTNTDCGGQTPVCSLTTHTCGACTASSQCGGATPFCAPVGDPLAGACVACVTTAECDSTSTTVTPICNKTGAGIDTCRACGTSAECVAATLEPVCLTTGTHDGACAQCAKNTDCSGATPVCADTGATNQCVECGTNADCSGTTPVCSAMHVCGPCTGNADCKAPTPACNTTTGACTACNVDSDCATGNWCDEGTHTCTATLANGVAVPSDPPHTSPTLNGTCTAAAGALVCQSRVCDTKDNECGYANGDGPCTAADGSTVCRSGTCSLGGVCEPAGGCMSDSDCTGGNWCDEATGTCTPKLANGTSVPVDAPHKNPTLDGQCTPSAATLVCQSGVCDTHDNKCGYANGDGPCTAGTAGTVCRSGACSTNGTCEPMGGCNVDGDCPGETCNTTTHTCQASVLDAGTPDGGSGKDAGPAADGGASDGGSPADGSVGPGPDGSVGPGADGSVGPGADGSTAGEDAAANNGAYLDGGGLSCGVAANGGSHPTAAAWALGALGLVAARRRRRAPRARRSSTTVA